MEGLTYALLMAVMAMACKGEPLKALLYCYLPAVNTHNTTAEYGKLASMVNQRLEGENINVRVQVCNDTTASKLYDPDQISTLFDDYDIVQVDVSYLWAVKTELLSFTPDQIDYFDQVFKFQWEPVSKNINGKKKLIGSPGLLCSNFIQTRKGDYSDRLYSDFSKDSAYGLVTLYLSNYVNQKLGRTLKDVNYNSVDPQTIRLMAQFLKDCQKDTSIFRYADNWCLNPTGESFFQTNYSKTVGYSQNLFNFINAGVEPIDIEIKSIAGSKAKTIFYADEFVAKNTPDLTIRKTVLDFYKFMLSDEILSIYVEGKYTEKPHKTYLIPPTIAYLKELARTDKIYGSIYNTAFNKAIHLPLYQQNFAQNVYSFAGLIDEELKRYKAKARRYFGHPYY